MKYVLIYSIILNNVEQGDIFMEYKNSYIFLKRPKKEKNTLGEDNTITINLPPSFMSLLKKSFKNIKFDNKNSDFINSGSIMIKKEKKK